MSIAAFVPKKLFCTKVSKSMRRGSVQELRLRTIFSTCPSASKIDDENHAICPFEIIMSNPKV